jgi:hypothetical protein
VKVLFIDLLFRTSEDRLNKKKLLFLADGLEAADLVAAALVAVFLAGTLAMNFFMKREEDWGVIREEEF